jgi:hypothetical protein
LLTIPLLPSGTYANATTSQATRVRQGFVELHSGNHDLSQLGSFRERSGLVALPQNIGEAVKGNLKILCG